MTPEAAIDIEYLRKPSANSPNSQPGLEDLFRSIVTAAPDPIAVYNPEGQVLYVNPAFEEVFGWRLEEVVGRRFDFAPQHELQKTADAFMRVCRGEKVYLESQRLSKEGRLIDVQLKSAAFFGLTGELAGVIELSRDISAQKHTEQALQKAKEEADAANRAKGDFVARMSHEIRTPMNAILGMCEILEETEPTKEQAKYLEIIQTSGEILLSTINNILDFSKIEANRLQLTFISFNIYDLVENVGMMLGVPAREKKVELVCRVDPQTPFSLTGDPVHLRQVMVNIVSNALKFTQQGEVVLEVKPAPNCPDYYLISVRDTGIGIAPEHQQLIFDSFAQVDTSTTRRFGGSGLGLSISKRLVEKMGGQIWVKSAPGAGAAFYFTVKLTGSDSTLPGLAEAKHQIPADLKKSPALIVDDNHTNRLLIAEHLARWEIDAVAVESGVQALYELERGHKRGRPYRIALLDINMPLMDGFETAEKIRRLPLLPQPILLILGSCDTPEFRAKAAVLNVAGFLVKPIKRDELLAELRLSCGLTAPQTDRRHRPAAKPPAPPETTRFHILLAEDAAPNRMMIHRFLTDPAIAITDAENGAIALEKAQTARYDLIFMDIEMPLLDGLAATQKIREWEKNRNLPPVPIIALTAHAFNEQRQECLQSGCDDFIAKPVKKADLLHIVQKYRRQTPSPVTIPDQAEVAPAAATESETVVIDSELEELIPGLLTYIHDSIAIMEQSLLDNNYKELHRLSHGLKGAVRNYGFARLGDLFFDMEQSAEQKHKNNIAAGLQKVRSYMERVTFAFTSLGD